MEKQVATHKASGKGSAEPTTKQRQDAKRRFAPIAGAIFANSAIALEKWYEAFQAFVASGFSTVKAYAECVETDEVEASTIQQNISAIKWAEEFVTGGAMSFHSLNALKAERAERNAKTGNTRERKRDLTKEAMKWSIAELEAMLAFRKSVRK